MTYGKSDLRVMPCFIPGAYLRLTAHATAVQVKKKMTCEEFIRNNRGINGGADLPHAFLRELYGSISQNEIRISADQQASGLVPASPVLWTDLAQQAQRPRGTFFQAQGMLLFSLPAMQELSVEKVWRSRRRGREAP